MKLDPRALVLDLQVLDRRVQFPRDQVIALAHRVRFTEGQRESQLQIKEENLHILLLLLLLVQVLVPVQDLPVLSKDLNCKMKF